MLLEMTVKQSQIGGLMFRGKQRLKGVAADGFQMGMEYLGRAKDGTEVYALICVPNTPSDDETFEAEIEFDFYHHQYWVGEVRVALDGEPDSIFQTEHLGREG